jgi:hypothetical protein
MEKTKMIYAPEYIALRNRKFDEIAATAYVNIFTLTKEADVIAIAPFDPRNKEHLFVLGVAKGVSGVTQKPVAIDTSRFQLWRINRGLAKEYRYEKTTDKDLTHAVDPNRLLSFMREWASKLMEEENFNFGQIYQAFYAKQKGNNK